MDAFNSAPTLRKRQLDSEDASINKKQRLDTYTDGLLETFSAKRKLDDAIDTLTDNIGLPRKVPRTEMKLFVAKGGFPRFVQQAKFNLFGNDKLPISIYSLYDEDAFLYKSALGFDIIYERATLQKPVVFGDLFEWIRGSSLGDLEMSKVEIVYQNIGVEVTKPAGLTVTASVSINEKGHSDLHDILVNFLGVTKPELVLTCCFSTGQPTWNDPLPPVDSYTLSGAFPHIDIAVCDAVHLTSLGLTINAFPGFELDEKSNLRQVTKCRYALRGSVTVKLPGLEDPTITSFIITKMESHYSISLDVDLLWKDAFGITGLTLRDIGLTSAINTSLGWNSMSFGLSAIMDVAGTTVSINGAFSFAGDFSFSLSMTNITWDTIAAVHKQFYPDEDFNKPDMSLSVGAVVLAISKADGLVISLDGVKLGDHIGANGALRLNKSGGSIDFGLQGNKLPLGELEIFDARISAELHTGSTGKTFSLGASGKFRWKSLDIAVGARLYTLPDDKELHYTIYGDLTDSNGGFRLGDHVPGIEDTPLGDIVLRKVMIVVASRADSHHSLGVPAGYEIQQGLQLAIDVGACESLSKLFEKDDLGLLMGVRWNPANPNDLKVALKTTNLPKLTIGDDFETGDIELALIMEDRGPKLSFSVGATLRVAGNKSPLLFTVKGAIDTTGVTVTGIMDGYWVNPFELSPTVKIGPRLLLSMKVTYELVPEEFGFIGGMQLGKTKGQMALQVAADPRKQLALIDIENLDLQDVLELLEGTDHALNWKPDNVVYFHKLKLYVCPFGTTIEGVVYPKGFMFDCEATFLNKSARVRVEVTSSGFSMAAWVDAFDIGPFRISGAEGSDSRLAGHLTINSQEQNGSLNGMIRGPGVSCAVVGAFSFQPFTIAFSFTLTVFNIISLRASMGPLPPADKEVAIPSASILDTGFQIEAEYESSLNDLLIRIVRDWKKDMHDDAERRCKEASEKLSEDPDPGALWNAIVAKVESFTADTVSPIIEKVLDAFRLDRIYIKAQVDKGATGFGFHAEVTGRLFGEDFKIQVDIELHDIDTIISGIIKKLKEWFHDALEKVFDEILDGLKEVANTVLEGLKKVVEVVEEAIEEAAEFVEEAVDEIGEAAKELGQDIEKGLDEFGHDVENVVNDIGQGLEDLGHDVDHVVDDIGQGLEDFGHDVENVVDDIGHGVENVVNDVGEVFEDIGSGVESVAGDIGGAISSIFSW